MAKVFDPSLSKQWVRLSMDTKEGQYMIVMPLLDDQAYRENGVAIFGIHVAPNAIFTLDEHITMALAEGGLPFQCTFTPHAKKGDRSGS